MKHEEIGVPRRRDEALAVIVDRLVRTGASPTFEEIGRAMQPEVSKTRAQELVKELIERGDIEMIPGAVRGLRVRDVTLARTVIDQVMRRLGWTVATPLGDLPETLPHVHLPLLPPFEHLPDVG